MPEDSKRPNDEMNLDLINMVQNARMQHDDDAIPSQVPGVYWIEAKRKTGGYPAPTPTSGEWQIVTDVDHVDQQWATVKQATERGQLGHKSKVSTQPAHNQAHQEARLICVRTYNADDADDVARIQAALLDLGFRDVNLSYMRDK